MYRISKIASIMCCRMPCCRANCMAAVHSLCSRCTDVGHPHYGEAIYRTCPAASVKRRVFLYPDVKTNDKQPI